MADLETATSVLRGLRREVREQDGAFIVSARDQDLFSITSEEIDVYLAERGELSRDTETQLIKAGCYEHVVQFEGVGPRRPYRREGALSLASHDGQTTIEIGRPSSTFCLCLTDVDNLDRELRRLIAFGMPGGLRGREVRPLAEATRLYTIRVSTRADTTLGRSRQRMHELAEAATFHFAFGQGAAISFTRSWERTYYWLGRKQAEDVQFPLRTYNSELVSYYNLALSTDSLVLGYLALYKIVEYFYTSSAEKAIHERLKEHLVAPDFSHTKAKKLRELVKLVRTHDNKFDELASLRLVLSEYFRPADLRQWVQEYEQENGEYFTGSATVFSNTFRTDLSDNTIIPNIASRIYSIRNALVHNKEGEVSRFIPYTGQEEVLHKEVQILLHVAEQIIIKSGKELPAV